MIKKIVLLVVLLFQLLSSDMLLAKNTDSLLKVKFTPNNPIIHLGKPTKVSGVTVYDHSKFSIKITNRHLKTLHMKSVIFTSIGDRQTSGLGDIINYWPWRNAPALKSGQSLSFNKVWGFTVDTPNTQMTYRYKFVYTLGNDSDEHIVIKDLILKLGN